MSTSATTPPPDHRKRPGEIGARAPGKLILSGEHSVVYGRPALAVAIETYIEMWFTPLHQTGGLRTVFENLTPGSFYPFDILKGFKDGLDRRFEDFMKGGLPVQNILQRPEDLSVYALTSLLPNLPVPGSSAGGLPVPGQLTSRSDMPLGAGLGSSAAVVAATSVLYEHLLRRPQSLQDRFERVRFCERLQHGRGSAIDASAVVFGGLNRVQGDDITQIELTEEHPLVTSDAWYWVHTGTPVSKTGECVAAVRKDHGEDVALWGAFEECTTRFEAALHGGDDPREVLTENHGLLCQIGVVPEPTKAFIADVEAGGGAAKVSGAGAVRGEHGGIVLVYQEDAGAMASLMQGYPAFSWQRVRIAREGAAMCPSG